MSSNRSRQRCHRNTDDSLLPTRKINDFEWYYRSCSSKENLLEKLNQLSHKESWTYMFLLGQSIITNINNNSNNGTVAGNTSEPITERNVNVVKSEEVLKMLLELSNEELPYYREVAAIGIRGVLTSFVKCVEEESTRVSNNVQSTNTKIEENIADNDDVTNSRSDVSKNDENNSNMYNYEKAQDKVMLSLYKLVDETAHKLLCDPLPRIAQLMCSVIIHGIIAAAYLEQSIDNREKEVDVKLFELLVQLVEHPVLVSFAVALQRARKCYLIDELCALVYFGKSSDEVATLLSTLPNRITNNNLLRTEEKEAESRQKMVTPTSDADFAPMPEEVATSISHVLHVITHLPLLSPSHKNYRKLLLRCNNTKLLTKIICHNANYSTLPVNVIHHLTRMHPLVMLNCLQELSCKHHLNAMNVENFNKTGNVNADTSKINSLTVKTDSTIEPSQLQQSQRELQQAQKPEQREQTENFSSISVCEESSVKSSTSGSELCKSGKSTANDAELELSMRLIPFMLKVLHALAHHRQNANVTDVATMFVFGVADEDNNDISEQNERNNTKDALVHDAFDVSQEPSTLMLLDLVHFPCSEDDKNKLIQHYFERRPRIVARYILQHLPQLPSSLQLELKGSMFKRHGYITKCISSSLSSGLFASTCTHADTVDLQCASCNAFDEKTNKQFHWLMSLINCRKVRNILHSYAHFPPELRELIYEKGKVLLQSSTREHGHSFQFTEENSDKNVIIDFSTLLSVPNAVHRADEGRRHFMHGDDYSADDHALRRISYLSLLPVHEAIALANENDYVHNKEVSIRAAVASALISGLPYQPPHTNTPNKSELQSLENLECKEGNLESLEKEKKKKMKQIEEESNVVMDVDDDNDQDNVNVIKVLEYCMERVNEQDPWKCAVMCTWSHLPCKVWKVTQKDVCYNKHAPVLAKRRKEQCHGDESNTETIKEENDEGGKHVCSLSTEQAVIGTEYTQEKCEGEYSCSYNYYHVTLLITFIKKCMSAKDISRSTLNHIAVLLVKVMCALYLTSDSTKEMQVHNKEATTFHKELSSIKQTVLQMWLALLKQRKSITHNEEMVLSKAPSNLISILFQKLTNMMTTEWLHMQRKENVNELKSSSDEQLINKIISGTISANENINNRECENVSKTNSDVNDKNEISRFTADCINLGKCEDSRTYGDMSEKSELIKQILTQAFTPKQVQTFLHDDIKSFLYNYCIDYTRHYSPHLCVVGLELFCHFFSKREQVAFVKHLLDAAITEVFPEEEQNTKETDAHSTTTNKKVRSNKTLLEIVLSFVCLTEIKVIVEKELQGKYLMYILEHLQEQEGQRELQKSIKSVAKCKDIESSEQNEENDIDNTQSCNSSQSILLNPRVVQFVCDLRTYVMEHTKNDSNRWNVSNSYDVPYPLFTCKYCKRWTAAQQLSYSRTILFAITHHCTSDLFAQRELFKLLGLMPDISLETLYLDKFIVFSTTSQSESSLISSSSSPTVTNPETNSEDSSNNNNAEDVPEVDAASTTSEKNEEERNDESYDKEFVRTLAIQLLSKMYDHESFDLLTKLLYNDELVKEAFAALRNRFTRMLYGGSNNNDVKQVFSFITSISNECNKVTVLKELLRYVGSMQSERAFQWLLEYGQKCKDAQLAKEWSEQELTCTSAESSTSSASILESTEMHSNGSEQWEVLSDVDQTNKSKINSIREKNEVDITSATYHEDISEDEHHEKEVNEQHDKQTEHDKIKRHSRNTIHGMHKDVFTAYMTALINFIDKVEVWRLLKEAIQCAEIKHQALICHVVCGIADDKIASVAWRRTSYTHLLLQLLQSAMNTTMLTHKTSSKSTREAAKSIIRAVLHKIIASRVDGISNTLLYEDSTLYPLCYLLMNKRFCTGEEKDVQELASKEESNDSNDDEEWLQELSLLSLECLLYCSNVPVQELVKEVMNATDDWELAKRVEQIEKVYSDIESKNNSKHTSDKQFNICKTKDGTTRKNEDHKSQITHTTTVSKAAISLIDCLLIEQRQPVLTIHLLLCTQHPQETWIEYITQMHSSDLLNPDVMSKCVELFKVDECESEYYYYSPRNAHAFADAHVKCCKDELLVLEEDVMRFHVLPFVRRLGLAIVTYFEHYFRCSSSSSGDNGDDGCNGIDSLNKFERIKQCQRAILHYRSDKEKWIRDAAMLVRLPKRK